MGLRHVQFIFNQAGSAAGQEEEDEAEAAIVCVCVVCVCVCGVPVGRSLRAGDELGGTLHTYTHDLVLFYTQHKTHRGGERSSTNDANSNVKA